MRVEGLWALDDNVFQLCVQLFEDCFREAGADVADGFVSVRPKVVAGEEEGTVDGGAFSFTVVGS